MQAMLLEMTWTEEMHLRHLCGQQNQDFMAIQDMIARMLHVAPMLDSGDVNLPCDDSSKAAIRTVRSGAGQYSVSAVEYADMAKQAWTRPTRDRL